MNEGNERNREEGHMLTLVLFGGGGCGFLQKDEQGKRERNTQ